MNCICNSRYSCEEEKNLPMIHVLKGRKLAASSTAGNQADQAPQTLHNPSLQLLSTPDPD
jgi:hypothetical protein